MQPIIRKLPNHVIDRIKAGEVVERPMSVVKELVENALDAGATQVGVELVEGGRRLIRVVDNGCGMAPPDLETCVERHATSKLPEDDVALSSLPSFGFRGEALPSVGAVSALTLRSRTAAMAVGQEITVRWGEKHTSPTPYAMAPGTEVLVENLFEKVPARLKFLKSPAVEMSHVAAYLNAFALAYPQVGFTVKHNGRPLYQHTAAHRLQDRLAQIFPDEGPHMVALDFHHGRFALTGFVGKPSLARPTPHFFVAFVNGRLVKDRLLKAAVMQGYTGFLAKGLYAPALIFVTVPPEDVDVNAHPCKTELRFTDPLALQDLVSRGVSQALRTHFGAQSRAQAAAFVGVGGGPTTTPSPGAQRGPSPASSRGEPEEKGARAFPTKPTLPLEKPPAKIEISSHRTPSPPPQSPQWGSTQGHQEPMAMGPLVTNSISITQNKKTPKGAHQPPPLGLLEEPQGLARARYLGQFRRCYLLLENEDEMWVVDQHAFHERILYEELQKAAQGKPIPRQALLAPITVPLGGVPGIGEAIEEKKDMLAILGFDVSMTPEGVLQATQVPAIVPLGHVVPLLEDLVVRVLACSGLHLSGHHPLCLQAAKAREDWPGGTLDPAQVYHLFYATVACHSAVRAGEALDAGVVERLLQRGTHVDLFSHCPHGRPVLRAFPLKEVEGWFLR